MENDVPSHLAILHTMEVLRAEAKAHSIALETLSQLLAHQAYRCAICERSMVKSGLQSAPADEIELHVVRVTRFATPRVDFCPETGVLRGLLCTPCRKIISKHVDLFGGLIERSPRFVKQPKWINPKPNRRHIKRKRKLFMIRRGFSIARFAPLKRRKRLLDYFSRELDASLISAKWEPLDSAGDQ